MRALVVPLLLLIAMFSAALYNSALITRQTDRWLKELDTIDQAVEEKNWSSAMKQLQKTCDNWHSHQTYLHIVSRHNELDEADSLFSQLIVLCDEENTAETRLHLADLRAQLKLLAEMEQLTIANIL